jgi:hypothetical protein
MPDRPDRTFVRRPDAVGLAELPEKALLPVAHRLRNRAPTEDVRCAATS